MRFSKAFSEEYAKLEERAEGGHGEAKYLVKIIEKGVAKLKRNQEAGKRILKRSSHGSTWSNTA